MTPLHPSATPIDIRSELASLPADTMSAWPLRWRFTDSKYSLLRPIHIEQIVPLAPLGARRLWQIIAQSRLHSEFPFMSGFFQHIEKMAIEDSHGNEMEDRRVRKRLYQQRIPFQTQIYLIWQPDWAVRTTWKMLVKYWTDFYHPISDDLTVFDGTFQWACLFWHEQEIFFGTKYATKHDRHSNDAS